MNAPISPARGSTSALWGSIFVKSALSVKICQRILGIRQSTSGIHFGLGAFVIRQRTLGIHFCQDPLFPLPGDPLCVFCALLRRDPPARPGDPKSRKSRFWARIHQRILGIRQSICSRPIPLRVAS